MTTPPYTSLTAEASTLIEARTGLAVSTQFRAELEPILREQAGDDLSGLLAALRASPETAPVWQRLIQALTIGETYFFRDPTHFHLLRDHLLANLVLERRHKNRLTLDIWCAGCATGEEPYSVAIALHTLLPDLDRWRIRLLGTDINAQALTLARAGVYRDWAFRHTDAGFRARHFDPTPAGWQIKPALRRMVTFQPHNLRDGALPQGLDIIFCRNVLIYFRREHIPPVERGLFDALNPGGWLLLGHAEAIRSARELWTAHVFPDAVIYQKPRGGPPLSYRRHTGARRTGPLPAAPVPDTYAAALGVLRADRRDEAERILSELLAQQPEHARAHVLLAYLFASRQAVPEAHAHLDAALYRDALLADAHYLRAMLFLEEGNQRDAFQALRAALYCQRDHLLAAHLLGNLYHRAGDRARARRAWEHARAAAAARLPDAAVSDLSDLTTASFVLLLDTQIGGLG
jgi:chemotaxis protein methyltransferase CheR